MNPRCNITFNVKLRNNKKSAEIPKNIEKDFKHT